MPPEKVTAHPSAVSGEGRRSKLGEILVENGAITMAQLEHALAEQAALKLPIGQVLIKLDYVTDETMRQALGLQLNVPYLDLENVMIDRSLARIINPTFARRHALLPVATVGRTLTVAMDDPTSSAVVQDLSRLTGFSVTLVTSSSRAIQRAFRRLYDDEPEGMEPVRSEHKDRLPARAQIIGVIEELDGIVSRQSELAFQDLLSTAAAQEATTVHVDVTPAGARISMRTRDGQSPSGLPELAARLDAHARELPGVIRTMAGIDGDHRGPATGRGDVSVDVDGRKVLLDVLVSILPCATGESIALRLIDRATPPRALEAMGIGADILAGLDAALTRRSGLVLVAATPFLRSELLHACLPRLDRPDARIVTVEDPILFSQRQAVQCEVGRGENRSAAAHLRAVQAHEADVVLVSDIADDECASLVCRLARNGTLVLAGMPGGAPVDVTLALADRGVPASELATSLAAVLAVDRTNTPAGPSLSASLWVPDAQDRDRWLEGATPAAVRDSARRTTLTR